MIDPKSSSAVNYRPELNSFYDVIVIGGGPAGASTAALLAEHGHDVLLLERSAVPRFHVGESLIPETYWPLKRLGLLDKLKASAFPKKYSVQFVSEGVRESTPFYFDMHNAHESSMTWQVERGPFDQMLLERAMETGTTVHTSAHVNFCNFESGTATGVNCRLTNEDGTRTVRNIQAKVVVDATGQTSLISSRRGERESDPRLKKATVWSYWKNAHRDSGKDEGATLIMQTPGKKSWFWYIPLPDNVVSVGCTGGLHYMFEPGHKGAEAVFQRELERCPAMQKRLQNGERSTDYLTTKDFSYYAKEGSGSGWVLVGDAFGFIDPVYSSGVFLALKGGEYCADAVHDALERNDLSGPRLGQWQPLYKQGIENFRKLVYAFYAEDFSFSMFLKQHPEYKSHMVDILVGDVFKPGVSDIFDAMGMVKPERDVPESQDKTPVAATASTAP